MFSLPKNGSSNELPYSPHQETGCHASRFLLLKAAFHQNPGVESCSFFPLAGNLINWKITDFRFSETYLRLKQTNHPCKQTWQEKCCVAWFMDHDKDANGGRNKSLRVPPNNLLLWWGPFFCFVLFLLSVCLCLHLPLWED